MVHWFAVLGGFSYVRIGVVLSHMWFRWFMLVRVLLVVGCQADLFLCVVFFFFNDTATTEIYTLSLHDALPICIASYASSLKPASGAMSNSRAPSFSNPDSAACSRNTAAAFGQSHACG